MTPPLAGRSFLATFGMLLAAIAALFTADLFLAKTDRAESQIEATRLFKQGQTLMKNGDNSKAIDRITDAIAIERDNREYLRTLARAQFAAGENSEAQTTLTGLLTSNSTDGLANLLMARVLAKLGNPSGGVSYFHRAIYGAWTSDAEGNRRRARLELIDLLAQQNSKEELLAELLPLLENAPQDLPTRAHLGELLLRADSPSRAADLFRGILRETPASTTALKGLGQAEFAQGDYRAAERDFEAVLRISADDPTGRHWLDLCNQLLQLDPTLRGLGTSERFRRSLALLDLVNNDVSRCLQQNSPAELQDLAATAAATLKALPARQTGDYEANLDLAEQLWQVRKRDCQPAASADSALALVLKRLSR
jgi:tetratricopeptide (TPR) repeat protein